MLVHVVRKGRGFERGILETKSGRVAELGARDPGRGGRCVTGKQRAGASRPQEGERAEPGADAGDGDMRPQGCRFTLVWTGRGNRAFRFVPGTRLSSACPVRGLGSR